MASESTGATPAPGWYPDPLGQTTWRFWDGARWSSYASGDGSEVEVDAHDDIAPPEQRKVDGLRAIAALASVLVMALATGLGIWRAGGDDPAVAVTATESPAPRDEPSPAIDPDENTSGAEGDDIPMPDFDTPEGAGPSEGPVLKVVYLTETSRGEEWEEIVSSDGRRSISRFTSEFSDRIRYYDGSDAIECDDERCYMVDTDGWANLFGSKYGAIDGIDTTSRRVAGRDAACLAYDGVPSVTCWDAETNVLLLIDPGDEAMEPSAFTSTRVTATFVGPPEPSDFDLPFPVEDEEFPEP